MKNIRIIFKETKRRMRSDNQNFFQAFKYEIDMFCIMGPNLYIKYSNGTAIEGKDFE